MMYMRLFIVSLLALLLFGQPAFSQNLPELKGPIVVTSETLTADNKARTALFETNVIAQTGDLTLFADRMLVHYRANTGEVEKIDASGNVRLQKEDRLITANQAVFFAGEERVEFTGNPRAIDGNNVITGTAMTYFIAEDRSIVENSRVILKNAERQ